MNPIESFDSLTLDDLNEFVTRKQEENLHLDFKILNDAALSSGDDKKNLARALSGFANSSGGMIIWGVDARKNAEGVDCAVELRPIDRVLQLLTRLNALTGEGVDPTVPGVRHRVIEVQSGRGFVLTLVPESDIGPHMAKLREDRYYKRSGDSFYKMEHYDIADMFGRRRKPKLCVTYRVTGVGSNVGVVLGLKNDGRAIARAPFVAFGCESTLQRSYLGLDGNRNEGLTYLRFASAGLPWAYGSGMDFVIHPGMAHDVAYLSLGIPSRPPPTDDVVVRYSIACEGQSLEQGEILIPIHQLQ
jgi:Putative DNA-binding domain